MDVDPDQLREAVETQHGGTATVITGIPIHETFEGQTVWEGVVWVFDLEGQPEGAKRAYAWSYVLDEETQKRRFFAVLHAGPITSAVDAVRAAIVAEQRAKK